MEKEHGGGSIYNETEAAVVTDLIVHLLRCGFESSRLGVICLYKAQVNHVQQRLRGLPPAVTQGRGCAVQVSTVDAFQVWRHTVKGSGRGDCGVVRVA